MNAASPDKQQAGFPATSQRSMTVASVFTVAVVAAALTGALTYSAGSQDRTTDAAQSACQEQVSADIGAGPLRVVVEKARSVDNGFAVTGRALTDAVTQKWSCITTGHINDPAVKVTWL